MGVTANPIDWSNTDWSGITYGGPVDNPVIDLSPTPTESTPAPAPQQTSYTAPPAPPPPPPAPIYPRFVPMQGSSKNVLTAPSDIIQFDETTVDVALMQDLLFENIGSVELANISRSDLIDGQETIYSPITNLSSVRREFNPNNIILTSSNNDYFTRFGINIFSKTIFEPYFDDSGNLVIEIEGTSEEEEVQVEILSNGTIDLVDEA
jgi:hypothetical protein